MLVVEVFGLFYGSRVEQAMIGRLVGTVVAEELDGSMVLDVHGVGYQVLAPLGSIGRASHLGDQLVFHIHTALRQDALELFGFASTAEREIFRLLIGVQKVGPKLALGLMSALPPDDLRQAITASDVARLSRVPGIGRKTAERLVLELRGKLPGGRSVASTRPQSGNRAEQLQAALTSMGYKAAEAERALGMLGERLESDPLSELLRAALALLAQPRA